MCCAWLGCATARAASPLASSFAEQVALQYQVKPDISYATASGMSLKLDLYLPRATRSPVPVVVYFYGGGWVDGRKENAVLYLMPYLAMGWAVANVEYRLGSAAPAPAAVQDAGVPNQLVTIAKGNHGAFSSADASFIHSSMRRFFRQQKILTVEEGK